MSAELCTIKIRGVKPLLVHAPTQLGDRPRLRRGEHLEPKAEAESYLYMDGQGNPCVPGPNVKACIREGARNYRVAGRRSTFAAMIRAGLEIIPEMIPLVNKGWKVDVRPVVVQRQRILRARPKFDEWALHFKIENRDPTVIHSETLRRIIVDAGRYVGLGDFRPEFGRFELEEFGVERLEGGPPEGGSETT